MQRKKRNHQSGLEKRREAYQKLAKEEIGLLGIVQENLRKSTDFLRRIIAPVGGREGVTLSYICPHSNILPLEDYLAGIDWTRRQQQQEEEALQLVVCGVLRQMRIESTHWDSGGAARHKRRRGESFQGACGPARTL